MDYKTEDRVYTTGQVAEICGLSVSSVRRLFDKGLIKGYRIPRSKRFRRIPYNNLVMFMKEYEIPLNLLERYLESTE